MLSSVHVPIKGRYGKYFIICACISVLALMFLVVSLFAGTAYAVVSVGSSPREVAVNTATNMVYVTNSGSDSVSVINSATDEVVTTIRVGRQPYGVSVNEATNKIYVANRRSDSVSVIDGSTNSVTGTIRVGRSPDGVSANSATNKIYVVNNRNNSVSVIDGSTDSVSSTISIGTRPTGIAANPITNKIYAMNSNDDTISIIDGSTDTVSSTIASGVRPRGVTVNTITNMVYVANYNGGDMSVIDGNTDAITATVSVGSSPYGISVNNNTNKVYVANSGSDNVSVINGSTNTVIDTITTGRTPMGVAANPVENKAYVANNADNNVSVIEELNPVPVVTELVPTSEIAGESGFTLTVNGSGLIPTSTVLWDGNTLATDYQTDTQLTADVDASYIASAGTASVTVINPAPGGGTSNAATFTINNPVPDISSLDPSETTVGGGDFTLIVNGTGLNAQSVVNWDGEGRTTSYVSGHLEATIPESDISEVGTADVTVTNPAPGGGTSNALVFSINEPVPDVSEVTPDSGCGGTEITVNGLNFGDTREEGSYITIGGTELTQYGSWSDTQITFDVPNSLSGGVSPLVVVTTGGSSDPVDFNVEPLFSTMSPNTGAIGSEVTLTGWGFGDSQGSGYVSFGDVQAVDYASWTNTRITCTVPSGIANVQRVTVTNDAGTSVWKAYYVKPGISSIDPPSGIPGTQITVNGTCFGDEKASGAYVSMGDTVVTNYISWSDTEIVFTAPSGVSGGIVPVTVTTYGDTTSDPVEFSVIPKLSTVGPIGDEVTLTGWGFGPEQGTSYVMFGDVPATEYVSWTNTRVTCVVPSSVSGLVRITVNTDGGTSNWMSFTVAPILSEMTPASGYVGTEVTLSGTHFGTEITSLSHVSVGDEEVATYISWSDTEIKFNIPNGTPGGIQTVTVTTPGGVTEGMDYSVVPKMCTMSPMTGPVGTEVLITGWGFGDEQGTSYVTFGDVQATEYVSWTNTRVTCLVPEGVSSVSRVKVVTEGGTSSWIGFYLTQ